MLRTLYAKLLVVFLLFCGAMTIVFAVVLRASHQRYHLESDQIANRGLAQQYIDNNFLLGERPVDGADVERAVQQLGAVNSGIDIYLLDGVGNIVASSVAEGLRAHGPIDVAPIQRILRGAEKLPILGQDPREPAEPKIFSVAAVNIRDFPAKYLYVVLRSPNHEAAVSRLQTDYAIGENLTGVAAVMLSSIVASLVVLRLLTRRLGRLESAMLRFRDSNFSEVMPDELSRDDERGDEIDRLRTLFAQLAELIRAQVDELRRTDEMRQDMLTSVSHDLRTPLATMQAQLEALMLHDTALGREQRREYLAASVKQGQRLSRLVDQLLQAAKLEGHQVKAEIEPLQLADLVQDVVQKFEMVARERNVILHAQAPDRLPLVLADAGLIERVLDNLIDNALQYSTDGGSVRIVLSAHGGAVRCSIADTGCGIAAADRSRILERFYRVDKSRSGGAGGHAGLGLSIVTAILQLHAASLHLESEVGAGSKFWFDLPLAAE